MPKCEHRHFCAVAPNAIITSGPPSTMIGATACLLKNKQQHPKLLRPPNGPFFLKKQKSTAHLHSVNITYAQFFSFFSLWILIYLSPFILVVFFYCSQSRQHMGEMGSSQRTARHTDPPQ
mmetsp:Transcript_23604/g.46138  ORF Transcript_23604/g.46138 Transcript_23604/m.46138 type:complete len:120 (-) Transcript_23604:139-498(-)